MSDSELPFTPKRKLERSPPSTRNKITEGPPEKIEKMSGSCNACGASIRLKGNYMKCSKCQEFFHAVCVGQQNEYFQFLESKKCQYICPSCTSKCLTIDNANEKLIRDTIKDSINSQLSNINSTIESSLKKVTENLTREMNERFQMQHNVVTKMISDNETKLQSQIDDLKNQILQGQSNEVTSSTVQKDITNLQAKLRQSNLMLTGIMETERENLFDIIQQIGMKLQIHLNQHDIKNAYRLKNTISREQNQTEPRNEKPSKIIIEFVHDHKKTEIFTKYLEQIKNKVFITGKDIGVNSDTRIYINQHLPQYIARIYERTIELKKKKIIDQTIPKPTHVLIKKNNEWKRIESISQLENAIKQ